MSDFEESAELDEVDVRDQGKLSFREQFMGVPNDKTADNNVDASEEIIDTQQQLEEEPVKRDDLVKENKMSMQIEIPPLDLHQTGRVRKEQVSLD